MKWKWAALAFAGILVAIIVMADTHSLPRFITDIYNAPGGDKVGHFVLMGTMAFLANLALRARVVKIASLNILLGSLIVTTLVALEELSQNFFPGRTPALDDFTASLAGILVLGWLATKITKPNNP
jgi:VanZ family protein